MVQRDCHHYQYFTALIRLAQCFLQPRKGINYFLFLGAIIPIILVKFRELDGKVLWHSQRMLVDTGASFSIVSNEMTLFSNWTPSSVKLLQCFEGSEKVVGFSDPQIVRTGMKMGRFNFDVVKLGHIGIIGMGLLDNWGIIIDLPNRVLRCAGEAKGCHIILVRHRCAALKEQKH